MRCRHIGSSMRSDVFLYVSRKPAALSVMAVLLPITCGHKISAEFRTLKLGESDVPVLDISFSCGISIHGFLDALKQYVKDADHVKDAQAHACAAAPVLASGRSPFEVLLRTPGAAPAATPDGSQSAQASQVAKADVTNEEHATKKATCAASPAVAKTEPLKGGFCLVGPNMGPLPKSQAPPTLLQAPSEPTSSADRDISWRTDVSNLNREHLVYEQRTKWENVPEKEYTRLLDESVLTLLTAQKIERTPGPRGFSGIGRRAAPVTRTQEYEAQDYKALVNDSRFSGACAADQGGGCVLQDELLPEASPCAADAPSVLAGVYRSIGHPARGEPECKNQ